MALTPTAHLTAQIVGGLFGAGIAVGVWYLGSVWWDRRERRARDDENRAAEARALRRLAEDARQRNGQE